MGETYSEPDHVVDAVFWWSVWASATGGVFVASALICLPYPWLAFLSVVPAGIAAAVTSGPTWLVSLAIRRPRSPVIAIGGGAVTGLVVGATVFRHASPDWIAAALPIGGAIGVSLAVRLFRKFDPSD